MTHKDTMVKWWERIMEKHLHSYRHHTTDTSVVTSTLEQKDNQKPCVVFIRN